MNYKLQNLYGNKFLKNERVVIAVEVPHVQSLASLIKLKKFYQSVDENLKFKDLSYKVYLRFRNRWLKQQKNKNKNLTCFYCGAKNLNPNINSPKISSNKQKATIDHKIPISKGGLKFCEKNLVVACYTCNEKKADKI